MERRTKEKLQRVPFSEMAQAIKRDKAGAKRREANENRRGRQLDPKEFTLFMTEKKTCEETEETAPVTFRGFYEHETQPTYMRASRKKSAEWATTRQ